VHTDMTSNFVMRFNSEVASL